MRTAILLTEGLRQIVFTPETKQEGKILNMLRQDEQIAIEVKEGSMFDQCRGGYLRAFECERSIILVIKPKEEEPDNNNPEPDQKGVFYEPGL